MTVNEMPEATETTTETTEAATETTATNDDRNGRDSRRAARRSSRRQRGPRRRKTREGVVVSNKMDKTAVVAVVDRVRHAKYNKFVLRTKKLYAHDEANDVNIGDSVRVMETRPLSKNKRWRVTEVLERAK